MKNEEYYEKVIDVMIKHMGEFFRNPEECFKKENINFQEGELEKTLSLIKDVSNVSERYISKRGFDFNEKLVLCSSSGY